MLTPQPFNVVAKAEMHWLRAEIMKYTAETRCTLGTGVINLCNNLPSTAVDSPQLFHCSHEQEFEKKILV